MIRSTLAGMILVSMGAAQAVGVPGQGSWETKLQARDLDGNAANGPEAFYDTDLKITWLRAGSDNKMVWADAKSWAETSSFFGLSGWRLPAMVDKGMDGCNYSDLGGTDCGYNADSTVATGSEMAHLFFQSLGNKSSVTNTEQPGLGLTNTGAFSGLRPDSYWYGAEYAPNTYFAWGFGYFAGFQGLGGKNQSFYALAVRPGDVITAVPEAQTYVMLLMGLVALPLVRRRKST